MARQGRSDLEQEDLDVNPVMKADVENTESVLPTGETRTADGPDQPDQADVDAAVEAHNDAEIAKAEDALNPDVPEATDAVHGTTTRSSRDLQR
jgi:hypothetical protein